MSYEKALSDAYERGYNAGLKDNGVNAVLGEVEALRAENKRLRELLYAMADANSVATMQSSAKLFKKWYEDEKKKGFNFA